MAITKKQVLKTMLLPGIFPRLREFFGTGFGSFSFLIATVYNTVRILPNDHPYLKPEMVGQYSVRQVIAEAANHITPSRRNIDQIIIFFSVIAALFILIMQFILLFAAMLVSSARAQSQPTTIEGFFQSPNPQEDLAYRMLDLIFGVPDFFGSKEKTGTALHTGLHQLFEFYSFGMLIVGVIIIIYFVIAVAAETAQSGTPFGQRFNKAWAPIRIILFLGLLLPLSSGLNIGQYLTLGAAKLGSNLASTGWILFNDTVAKESVTILGEKKFNVATPNPPDLKHLPAFMLVTKTCEVGYNRIYDGIDGHFNVPWNPKKPEGGVKAWAVYKNLKEELENNESVNTDQENYDDAQKAYEIAFSELEGIRDRDDISQAEKDAAENKLNNTKIAKDNAENQLIETRKTAAGTAAYASELAIGKSFQDLTVKSQGTDIHIVFGVKDPTNYQNIKGSVKQICGEIVMKVTDVKEPGTRVIQTAYYNLILEMWNGTGDLKKYAENYNSRYLGVHPVKADAPLPDEKFKQTWVATLNQKMNGDGTTGGIIEEAVKAQIDQGDWQMPQEMRDFGWGGAGIWYNTIAQQNGALVSALYQAPAIMLYPKVMEETREQNIKDNQNLSVENQYNINASSDSVDKIYDIPAEREVAYTLSEAYRFWAGSGETSNENKRTGNVLIDTINALMGTQGLFEICKNTAIHPLAQLSAVGKSMIDHSIGAFAASGILSIGSIIPNPISASASSFASFFGTVGSVGLLIGFILFYVLPFMPFLYFFFAVGEWVKSIFEAMVAVPLWALAHLRIDGDSIPGEAGINGYYLLFDIFLRPILVVFGLLAAISIFAAMVKVLNEVFYLAISNMSGHDPKSSTACFQNPAAGVSGAGPDEVIRKLRAQAELKDAYRGPIDEFFFTILYTIMVYMIGNSCFKLIDRIPNNITRWFNGEISTFNTGDSAEGMMTYITIGGRQFGEELGGSISGLGSGIKGSVQQIAGQGK